MGVNYYYDNIYLLSKEDCKILEMSYSKDMKAYLPRKLKKYLNLKFKGNKK